MNCTGGPRPENLPLYAFIRHIHGKKLCNTLKDFAKHNKKLAALTQSRIFLVNCRRYGLIPNCIKHSSVHTTKLFNFNVNTKTKNSNRLTKMVYNFHAKVLNLLIEEKCMRINDNRKYLNNQKERISGLIDSNTSNSFFASQECVYNDRSQKLQKIHAEKLTKLKKTIYAQLKINMNNNKKWFVNHTNVIFTEEVSWLLSLGKKFALPYTKTDVPFLNIIADGEHCMQLIRNLETQKVARANFCANLNSFCKKFENNMMNKFILRIYEDAKKMLSRHRDIIVLQSDKGGVTVVMYKKDYMNKMQDLVFDRNTYRLLRKDPTSMNQTKNNNYVKYLKDFKYIDDREKSKLMTYTSVAPKLYGLPKIHKQNIPFRPIVSSINSPAYGLSKFLAKILKNLTTNSKYNVKNSLEFKEKISKIKIETGEILVSFDVVSLFTNVPIQSCITIIDREWNRLEEFTDIPKKKFLEMLKFCVLDNNYFSFNKNLHKQVFGTPMGSPLSPILADIIMEDLLDNVMKKGNLNIKLILKYVDDLFAVIPEEKLLYIHNCLNNYHQKLKFTVEKGVEGSLSFLDTKVLIKDGKLVVDWYQKEISSGRLLNFYSQHPKYQIINTAKNFIRRVLGVSCDVYHKRNKEKIHRILADNNFPERMVSKLIKGFYCNRRQNNQNEDRVMETKRYVSATYVPRLSENMKQQIRKSVDNIDLAFKPEKTVNTLFSKLKEKTKKELYTDIIYKIPCGGKEDQTCDLNYIGTTKQFLKNRLANHKSDIKCKNSNKTALAQHAVDSDHVPDFESTEILAIEKNTNKRLILEALYIQTADKTMNRKTDVENISESYCSLLKSYKCNVASNNKPVQV